MLRSLTPASLQLSRLRCSILVTVRVEPVLSSRFAPPRSPLPAMSTAIQPTAHNNRNKRTADKQHSGKWKKRQVWRDNNEGSRSREDRQSADGQQQASTDTSGNGSVVGGDAVEKRLPKRKVAVVFGYNGGGYSGLQIQSGSDKRTIEADVADAILAAGGMIAANREQLSKVNWQRCARTDKGVHAATNLLSLNIITEPDGLLQVTATAKQRHCAPASLQLLLTSAVCECWLLWLCCCVVVSAPQLSFARCHPLLCLVACNGLLPCQVLVHQSRVPLHTAGVRVRPGHQPTHHHRDREGERLARRSKAAKARRCTGRAAWVHTAASRKHE